MGRNREVLPLTFQNNSVFFQNAGLYETLGSGFKASSLKFFKS